MEMWITLKRAEIYSYINVLRKLKKSDKAIDYLVKQHYEANLILARKQLLEMLR